MIKITVVAQVRSGMDPEEAWRFWVNHHAPNFTAKCPGVKRYVLSHCVDGWQGGGRPFLGVGEVWFESREEAERVLREPEWEAAFADSTKFLDMERTVLAWTEEHQIV